MDIRIEDRARTREVLHLAAVESAADRPGLDPRLGELRGEAMRRLFPKSSVRTGRPEAGVAQRIYAWLAEADTVPDLQRRLRSASRNRTSVTSSSG